MPVGAGQRASFVPHIFVARKKVEAASWLKTSFGWTPRAESLITSWGLVANGQRITRANGPALLAELKNLVAGDLGLKHTNNEVTAAARRAAKFICQELAAVIWPSRDDFASKPATDQLTDIKEVLAANKQHPEVACPWIGELTKAAGEPSFSKEVRLAAIAGLTELVLLPEKPLIDALRSAAGDPSAEVKAAARKTLKHFIDKGDIRLDQVQDVMQDVDPIQQRIDDILKETVPSRVTIPEFKRTLSLQKELTALAKTKADYKGTEVATKAAEFKAWLESSAVTKLPEEARLDKDFVVTTDGQPPVHTSYRIVDQLGEGGMARVFLAEKVGEPGSRYAIKVLLPGFIKGFRSTHIVEGNIITEMDHPNIVKGYGGGDLEIPGQTARPFFVMEQVQTSLDKVLNRLSDEQKLAVLRQVEEALNFAWSTRKILHRDVKPENILVELDDSGALVKVKLADFGVAKDLGDPESGHTRTGTLKGTVKVTAPEAQAIAGLKHDDREAKLQTAGPLIDIYAWGITAYRIFARQYPPERTCHSELEWSHFCTAQGADLAKYALKMPDVTPPIPAEIWPVIVKATEMNPADRFQSWKDVQTSLSGLTMEIAKTQVGDKPASEGIAALLKSLDGIDGLTLTQTVDLALLVQGKIDELEAKAATVELSAEETAFMARLVDTAPGLQAIIDLKEGGLS